MQVDVVSFAPSNQNCVKIGVTNSAAEIQLFDTASVTIPKNLLIYNGGAKNAFVTSIPTGGQAATVAGSGGSTYANRGSTIIPPGAIMVLRMTGHYMSTISDDAAGTTLYVTPGHGS